MSYLESTRDKKAYFDHISSMSHSHRVNSRIALDWFDKFLIGKFEKDIDIVLSDLIKGKYQDPQKHTRVLFDILQDFIKYVGVEGHDPSTIRANFNLIKNFLNWYGFEIYTEIVKSRLKFPKKIEEEAYPLTLEDIIKILEHSKPKRQALYYFLSSTGCRIQEALQVRKRDLDFESYDRIMVRLAGKYTKTKKPRKTFITKETEKILTPILNRLKDDDLIFGVHDNSLKGKHNEEDNFTRMRIRAGLTEKYDNGIHKITMHSFRSWFITKCNRVDSDFGHHLAGHQKYMKKYNRFEESELCDLFIKAESTLSIYDRVDEDQEDRIADLEGEIIKINKQKTIMNDEDKLRELINSEILNSTSGQAGLMKSAMAELKRFEKENQRLVKILNKK